MFFFFFFFSLFLKFYLFFFYFILLLILKKKKYNFFLIKKFSFSKINSLLNKSIISFNIFIWFLKNVKKKFYTNWSPLSKRTSYFTFFFFCKNQIKKNYDF